MNNERRYREFECFCNVVHQSTALREYFIAEHTKHIQAIAKLHSDEHRLRVQADTYYVKFVALSEGIRG